MTYIGSFAVNDTLTFVANTQRFDTGAATDADSVPSYRVYEDETTAPILTGSMALLDGSNTAGFYSEQITLSAANGFEVGKCYSIYIAATVNSVAGATHRTFQMLASVNVETIDGTAPEDGDTLVDKVWNEAVSGHTTAGTTGKVLQDVPGVAAIQSGLATAASITTLTAYVDTEVAAIKAKTDALPNSPAAVSDIPTAAQNAAQLLTGANGVESGVTVRDWLRLVGAVMVGKATGLTGNPIFRDLNDTKARVTVTQTADARTAVTTDPS